MIITTKFNLYDDVFCVYEDITRASKTCYVCDGIGNVTLKDANYCCPECGGTGFSVNVGDVRFVYSYMTIQKINILLCLDDDDSKSILYTPSYQNITDRWFPEEDIFQTEEEAIAECGKRNKA